MQFRLLSNNICIIIFFFWKSALVTKCLLYKWVHASVLSEIFAMVHKWVFYSGFSKMWGYTRII